MAKRSHTKQIDGYDVTVTQFEPFTALRLGPRVMKIVMPLLKGGRSGDKITLSNASVVTVEGLLDQLGSSPEIVYELLAGTTIIKEPEDEGGAAKDPKTGKILPQVYDLGDAKRVELAFVGRLDLMLKVAYYAAEVNFFRYFFDLIAQAKKKAGATEALPPSQ